MKEQKKQTKFDLTLLKVNKNAIKAFLIFYGATLLTIHS